MWFRKKKSREKSAEDAEPKGHNDVLSDRLSRIGNYTHDYDESERHEVEARIRRMFYGAKVEGSLAERANDARDDETEGDPEADPEPFGNAANG